MPPRSLLRCAGLLSALALSTRAQPPTPTPSPKAPPPLRLLFSALVPEATFAIAGPRDFAATEDALWVSSRSAGSVSRIDPKTNKIVETIAAGKDLCVGIVADFGSVLVPQCAQNRIARVDAKKNSLGDVLPTFLAQNANSLAAGVGSLWVITDAKGTIARIDPVADTVVALVYTAPGATSIGFGEGGLWVASARENLVTRVNPYTNVVVETIAVANGPSDIAIGEGAVWTWNRGDGSVTRMDPKANAIVTTIKLGAMVGAEARIVAGEGSVWVAGPGAPLTRIDPRTNQVAQMFTGAGGSSIAIAHGSIWITASPAVVWRLDPRRIEATRDAGPTRPKN